MSDADERTPNDGTPSPNDTPDSGPTADHDQAPDRPAGGTDGWAPEREQQRVREQQRAEEVRRIRDEQRAREAQRVAAEQRHTLAEQRASAAAKRLEAQRSEQPAADHEPGVDHGVDHGADRTSTDAAATASGTPAPRTPAPRTTSGPSPAATELEPWLRGPVQPRSTRGGSGAAGSTPDDSPTTPMDELFSGLGPSRGDADRAATGPTERFETAAFDTAAFDATTGAAAAAPAVPSADSTATTPIDTHDGSPRSGFAEGDTDAADTDQLRSEAPTQRFDTIPSLTAPEPGAPVDGITPPPAPPAGPRAASVSETARRLRDPRNNTLAVMGGARRDAIVAAPGDRQSYTAMALILMFTATVAALSMAFALGMIFHADWYWFIPIGIFWGAGIFAIDRALTIQLAKTRGFWRTSAAVIPRLALAAILGAVVSTPVTLQIFEPEIDTQILTMQADARADYAERIASDPVLSTEDELRTNIAANQAIVNQSDATDPLQDPAYAAAKAAEDAAYADYQAKTDAWVAESNGTGGTGIVGTGPITEIARAAADAAQGVYEQAKAAADAALATAQTTLAAQLVEAKATAETALAADKADLAVVVQRKADLQAANDSAVASSDGIANRLTALDELGKASPAAGTAHIMVFLLFFAIELLPVIIKLLRNTSKDESVHDLKAFESDRTEMELTRQRYAIVRDAAQLDARLALGSLVTKRELAAHAEELALDSGRRDNVELDKRRQRLSREVLADWDAEDFAAR